MYLNNETNKSFASLLREGNEGAFKEFYLSFYKAVLYFIRQYVRNEEDCQDLVQETFFYFWKNRKKIDPTKDYRSYLLSIARSRALNYLREERYGRKHIESLSVRDYEIDTSDTALDQILHKDLLGKINVEIGLLPEKQREVMILSRKKYFTNKEIAQKLRIDIKTVEYRLMIALKQIRKKTKIF